MYLKSNAQLEIKIKFISYSLFVFLLMSYLQRQQPYENDKALERPANSDKSFYYLLSVDAVAKVEFHSDEEVMGRGFRAIFRSGIHAS